MIKTTSMVKLKIIFFIYSENLIKVFLYIPKSIRQHKYNQIVIKKMQKILVENVTTINLLYYIDRRYAYIIYNIKQKSKFDIYKVIIVKLNRFGKCARARPESQTEINQ